MNTVELDEIESNFDLNVYVPSFAEIRTKAGLPEDALSQPQVTIPVRLLRFLLSQQVARLPFDAEAYGALNPDVAEAVEAGIVKSLHEHYIRTGWFEGRNAGHRKIDAAWYGSYYKDLALAVRRGAVKDLEVHFNEAGRLEGRVGSEGQLGEKAGWDWALS